MQSAIGLRTPGLATAGQRAPSAGLFKETAFHLLARSIDYGHGSLSVVRLAMAVRTGAVIPAEHWDFCRQAALNSESSELQRLFLEAVQTAASPAARHAMGC